MKSFIYTLIWAGLARPGLAVGHVLLRYPIHSVQSAPILFPDYAHPGIFGGLLTQGPNESGLQYNGLYNIFGNGNGYMLARAWTSSENPDPSQYIEFSISIRENCRLLPEGISLALWSQHIQFTTQASDKVHEASGPTQWKLQASLDNFATPGHTILSLASTPSTQASAASILSIDQEGDFSTMGMLEGGTSVTFRLYGYAANSPPFNLNTYPAGGLVHANNANLGQDLILHGKLYCKKSVRSFIEQLSNGIRTPLEARLGAPVYSFSFIPEPASWGLILGLLSLVIYLIYKRIRS